MDPKDSKKIKNPLSNRWITIGGRTHKKLVADGTIHESIPEKVVDSDPRSARVLDPRSSTSPSSKKVIPTQIQKSTSTIKINFKKHRTIYFSTNEIKSTLPQHKIAAFDLDDTIIVTKSGKVFAKSSEDWKFAFDNIQKVLLKYHNKGYKIVIFSNQYTITRAEAGKGRSKVTLAEFQTKLKNIIQKCNVPIEAYFSLQKDSFRKPMTDIWDFFMANQGFKKHSKSSFFCGNAAGRPKNFLPGHKKDFSSSDRYFAENLKIKFYTPEEVFQDTLPFKYVDKYKDVKLDLYYPDETYPVPWKEDEDTDDDTDEEDDTGDDTDEEDDSESDEDETRILIIMVGAPASGKSTLSKDIVNTNKDMNFLYLNNDELGGSKKKLQKLFEKGVGEKRNIIIDNTNRDLLTRAYYIKFVKSEANAVKYRIYTYFFDFPKIIAFHLNQMRTQITHGVKKSLSAVVLHTYFKNLISPTVDEGFEQIIRLKKLPLIKNVLNDTFKTYYYYKYDLWSR